jgi:hypothetical protein
MEKFAEEKTGGFNEKDKTYSLKKTIEGLLRSKSKLTIYQEMVDFAEQIKKEFPNDYFEYQYYHFLIGSTPKGDKEKIDFPGEYSVEKFISQLKEKYRQEIES